MGFTPREVGQMSVWQYMAALDGYIAANSTEDDKGLTKAEEDDLAAWLGI